ncbi:MAG: SAM-dependent chlorinase/fluorinase [Bacteroidetes bacterium]|nr:SAM-dependent chlorinase/fluorinase [Bacteroidota bacterium]MCY4205359.1 SAM-dependent chlorinase/fluorinase [Bacteroidota bacterium]
MDRSHSIITLTSDFGNREGYVGAMKGIMLAINPSLTFIDISHEVHAYDVMAAAFILQQSLKYFPPNTIHLVVVDPGVGTDRQAVALRHKDHYFVGPDNGLFTLLLETEIPEEIVALKTCKDCTLSDTFHGRDIFAPAAAKLASGVPLEELGAPIKRLMPLHWALPIDDNEGIRGWVVYIDHFGNCITNISRELFEKRSGGRKTTGYAGSGIIRGFHRTYSDVPIGETLMLFGSSNLLEVATNQGDAATLLHIQRGTPVNIVFSNPED